MLRKLLIFLVALVAFAALIFFLAGEAVHKMASLRVEEFVQMRARDQGIVLAFDEFRLTWKGVRAERVLVRPEVFPFAVELSGASMNAALRAFIERDGTLVTAHGRAYEGEMSVEYDFDSAFRVRIKQLNFEKLLPLRSWGIVAGLLEVDVAGVIESGNGAQAEFLLSAEEVRQDTPIFLGRRLTGLPMDLDLPALGETAIVLRGQVSEEQLELSEIQIASEILNFEGQSSSSLRHGSIDLRGVASFSEALLDRFGGELSLLAAGRELRAGVDYRFEFRQRGHNQLEALSLREVL